MSFQIQFRSGIPHSKRLEDHCRELAVGLEAEFPETHRVEIAVGRSGEQHEAHVHVSGKDLSVSSSSHHRGLREAADDAFSKAHRQLRKHHDKLIFARRREGNRGS